MTTPTTNMGLLQGVDGDNARTYLKTSLANSLSVVDVHDHSLGDNSKGKPINVIPIGGLQITSGCLAIGAAVNPANALTIIGSNTTGATQRIITAGGQLANNATSEAYGLDIAYTTAVGSNTITNNFLIRLEDVIKGAGSSITNNYGLYINSLTSGTTNNIGLYNNSTTYLFGNVGIGQTFPNIDVGLYVASAIVGSSTIAEGIRVAPALTASVNSTSISAINVVPSVNPNGKSAIAEHGIIIQTFNGTGSAVAIGLRVDGPTTGGTLNYGIYINAPSGATANIGLQNLGSAAVNGTGTALGFFNNAGPTVTKQTITGSRGANAALASLLTALALYGLITDSSS